MSSYLHKKINILIVFSSLDELDEDLLSELDHIVRENQLAYLPFARSGRAEALLFDKYPELAERIERSKRAKVDAIVLSNKFSEGDGSISTSFRAQSLEELSVSPLRQRNRRRASREGKHEVESPAGTPALKAKSSATDLMFEMSDGDDDQDESDSIRQPQFTPVVAERDAIDAVEFTEGPWGVANRKDVHSPLGASTDSYPAHAMKGPKPSHSTPERTPGRPWGPAPLAAAKLDLKDIMAQASGSTPSNLTLGLSQQDKERKTPGSSHTKMSQKERKRIQQAHQLGQSISERAQPAPPTVSPWQARASSQRTPSENVVSAPISPPPEAARTSSTPQLTMRQTVANSKSKKKEQEKGRQTSQSYPAQTSSSQKLTYTAADPSGKGMAVSTTPIPTPQSVRHIPLPTHSPTSPSQHMTMHEILSLQQAEKDYVRDAAAKRSLQEIQQEQEFQAWWDQESKRVIQEEEQRKRAEERAAKASRGRGKGRGGKPKSKAKDKKEGEETDRARPNKAANQASIATEASTATFQPKQDGVDKGKSRGKGQRGGRGGGRGGRPQNSSREAPVAAASATPKS